MYGFVIYVRVCKASRSLAIGLDYLLMHDGHHKTDLVTIKAFQIYPFLDYRVQSSRV